MQSLVARGRAHFERNEWDEAYTALRAADESTALDVEDLDRLAWSAGLTARDEEMLAAQERVYLARLGANEICAAARAAFWLGFRLLARGESGLAGGWLSRAQRLADQEGPHCVEQGYLLLPRAQMHLSAGERADAHAVAARAAEFGERLKEPDLLAFARNIQGRALLSQGQLAGGLAMLDEAMVAVASGELSPVVIGILYCSAIASCQRVYALDRAREWTTALNAWRESLPQLEMFTGHCLVHRAELLQFGGSWEEAAAEARRAVKSCVRGIERDAAGHAHYQQAEIHRLCGEFAAADAAYRDASRLGFEPQPGLALLRLAEGDRDTAASAIRRVLGATRDPAQRTRYLPAYVEIMVAVGDLDEARVGAGELREIAASWNTDVLTAIADHASGAVLLAQGNPSAVLEPARSAFSLWQRIGAPYLAARLRVLIARACIALGDFEGARLELDGAREVFSRLRARPDLRALDALGGGAQVAPASRGLTTREIQVLRMVASGKTNKAIARELSLSEKTVDRHVSNIFVKVRVSSRASATAFAYENKLI